jgi:LTXXQ motif family protein
MTRNRKLLIGGLALVAVVGGVAAASAHRHGGWGQRGGMERGGMGGLTGLAGGGCRGEPGEIADTMMVRLEYKVKPTDAQKPAFEELKAAARAAAVKAKAGCPAEPARSADGARQARLAPTERLAMIEKGLEARLEAVRTVRPAADKFYASLSEEQKTALSEHGGRHGGGEGWSRRGERGERGAEGRDRGPGRDGQKPEAK